MKSVAESCLVEEEPREAAWPWRTRRVLCCRLPGWTWQWRRSELPGAYHLFYRVEARRGRVVATASPAAWACGVRRGMPLAEAESLLPGPARVWPHDPAEDRRALERLAVWAQQFAPVVGVESPPAGMASDQFSPECLLADVTHVCHYFGGEWNLVHRLHRAMACRGLQVRLAVAHSVGAAQGAAQAASFSPVVVPAYAWPDRLPRVLAELPVRALRLPAESLRVLGDLGLTTVGALAEVPREAIRLRLGPGVVERLEQFLGIADEPIVAVTPPMELSSERVLESPASSWEELEPAWREAAGELAERLASEHRGVLELEVELQAEERVHLHTLEFTQACTALERWLELWRLRRESEKHVGPVHKILLRARSLARLPAPVARSLFDGRRAPGAKWRERAGGWRSVLERLTAKLGRRSVVRVRLVPDPFPERSWEAVTPTRRPPRWKPDRWGELAPGMQPLTLLSSPKPLPDATCQVPRFLRRGGRREKVRRRWGPRRIEGGWREGKVVVREYYHLETESGRRYWVFYAPREERWYLHGWDG